MSSSTANEFGLRAWAALKQAGIELPSGPPQGPMSEQSVAQIIEGAFLAFRKARPRYGEQGADALNQIPPSAEAVAAYFAELQSTVNPQDFMDYYDSKGWAIGTSRVKMKDWKAACRLWHRREQTGTRPGQVKPQLGNASLFALQTQLKVIETELTDILYPGGSVFKVTPEGKRMERYKHLMAQRTSILLKIDQFGK